MFVPGLFSIWPNGYSSLEELYVLSYDETPSGLHVCSACVAIPIGLGFGVIIYACPLIRREWVVFLDFLSLSLPCFSLLLFRVCIWFLWCCVIQLGYGLLFCVGISPLDRFCLVLALWDPWGMLPVWMYVCWTLVFWEVGCVMLLSWACVWVEMVCDIIRGVVALIVSCWFPVLSSAGWAVTLIEFPPYIRSSLSRVFLPMI